TEEFSLERLRNCRFSCTGQTGEPDYSAAMTGSGRSRFRRDFSFYPKNIFALRDRAIGINAAENCAAAANLAIIRDDKASKLRNAIMIVDHQRTARLQCQPTDFV